MKFPWGVFLLDSLMKHPMGSFTLQVVCETPKAFSVLGV